MIIMYLIVASNVILSSKVSSLLVFAMSNEMTYFSVTLDRAIISYYVPLYQ